MPLYEFQCDECGHRFEIIQKFSDPPPAACPKCGGPVHKLVSSPAFQFKGTGWYVTDYAKKSDGQKSSGGSAESKDGSSKDAKESKESKESKSTGEASSKDAGTTGSTSAPANPGGTSTPPSTKSS
jgi:putative FmdB family regulatory protein